MAVPRFLVVVLALTLAASVAIAADSDWKLVWEDNFDRDEVGNDWFVVSGKASIQDGRLLLEGGGATIVSERGFAPDVRMEFDSEAQPGIPPCDLSVALAANSLRGYNYLLAFGGKSNQANQLIGHGVWQVDDDPPFVIEHGKEYHMAAQKEGRRMTYTVNGVKILDAESTDILGGPGFDKIGFVTWAGMLVDDLKVYERKTPSPDTPIYLTKIPPLPLQRQGRKLALTWIDALPPPDLPEAIEAFNAGKMNEALEKFEGMKDTIHGLVGMAYVMGDLRYEESDRRGDFKKLSATFREAAKAQPDNKTIGALSQAADWFDDLVMKRSGRVSAYRLVGLGTENNPFYYKARLYQARYLYWDGMEGGDPKRKSQAVDMMAELMELWPEHVILRQYTGEKIPWGEELNADTSKDPAWAAYLREAYARMIHIMERWFDLRQDPDGQLGGGWGDDVELMRTWMQIGSISTGTEKVAAGIQKLADGVWDCVLQDGYDSGMGDVEHSAEPSADTLPTMLLLRYGDPQYVERNLRSAKTIKERFMGIDKKGYPRFISTEFGTKGVNTNRRAGGDTGYHARAMKHLIWLAWWGNPEAEDWFVRWADGWRATTMQKIDTKLPGVAPGTIWYPSGEIFPPAEGVPWWDGKWNYYGGLGLGGMVHDSFLAAYYFSGDPKFLEPFQVVMDTATKGPLPTWSAEEGSEEWCRNAMYHGADSNKTALYQRLTGERVYDEYTLRFGDPAQNYRTNYDLDKFMKAFEGTAEGLRSNLEFQTTEVLSTDRAALGGALTVFGAYTGAVQGLRDAATPTWAVTYETPDANFAALVVDSTPKRLRVWIHSFWDEPTEVGLRVWQLEPGRYILNQGGLMDGEREGQHRYGWLRPRKATVTHRAEPVYVTVPAHETWAVDLRLDEPIEVPDRAPDLAIHPRDVAETADSISVTVHNVGSKDAGAFTVAVQQKLASRAGQSQRWATVAEEKVDGLKAPRKLVPYTKVVTFKKPGDGEYRVVVDPEDKLYEICELNNVCEMGAQ